MGHHRSGSQDTTSSVGRWQLITAVNRAESDQPILLSGESSLILSGLP
jgi:hypothetical protein